MDKGRAPAPRKPWRAFLENLGNRCARAFAEWFAHCLLLLAILAVIKGLQCGLELLHIETHNKAFGFFSIAELFEALDHVLLIAIGIIGVVAAVRSYLGKD